MSWRSFLRRLGDAMTIAWQADRDGIQPRDIHAIREAQVGRSTSTRDGSTTITASATATATATATIEINRTDGPAEPKITQGKQLRKLPGWPEEGPLVLVIHDSEGYNLDTCEQALQRYGSVPFDKSYSAHFGIERGPYTDNTQCQIRQWVPLADRAVHAEGLGATWLGRSDCNSFSIGVELINFGTAEQYTDQAVTYDPKKNGIPEYGPVSEARTLARLETYPTWSAMPCSYMTATSVQTGPAGDLATTWQATYPGDQLVQLVRLWVWLVDEYGIVPENIVGHEHLTASKPDPGPAFPWVRFFELMEAEVSKYEDLRAFWFDLAQDEDLRVKALQSHLKRLSLYSLYIDGIWGAGTSSGLVEGWKQWGEVKGWNKAQYDSAVAARDTLTLCKFYVQIGGKYR